VSIIDGNTQRIDSSFAPQLPSMSGTVEGWFQNLVIGLITSAVVAGRVQETTTDLTTRGVIQPLSARQIEIKPEGERQWKWYMLHCQPSLRLRNDDTVVIGCDRYRVMSYFDYSQYGYVQYELVRDYDTVIPPTAP
jgi:hypothetical protein